jgi:hypothetical protein
MPAQVVSDDDEGENKREEEEPAKAASGLERSNKLTSTQFDLDGLKRSDAPIIIEMRKTANQLQWQLECCGTIISLGLSDN